jgi:hypothetical protein
MTSNFDIVRRFVDYHTGNASRLLRSQCGSVYVNPSDTREILSWGRHFPLTRIMGETGDRWWLLNGDRYSTSTSRHQRIVRDECHRSGLPVAILPFSALGAAGIDPDSIRVIDQLAETTITRSRTSAWLADVPKWLRWDESRRAPDGLFHWDAYEHRLGACLFAADYLRHIRTVEIDEADGDWRLGAETRRGRWRADPGRACFLSDFDYQESPPLYFLAQLPDGAAPAAVAEALEALKPVEVVKAELEDQAITRQGDIFAIASCLTRRELKAMGAVFARRHDGVARARLLDTSHTATETAVTRSGDVYARGCLYHDPGSWRRGEHKRQRINDGKTWARVVRNTVPWSGSQANAWTIAGGVD